MNTNTSVKIPIQNIYYLLCYAYNKLNEGKIINVSAQDATKLVDLFCRVLISGTTHLIKRGLDRGYVGHSDDTRTLRGKINFPMTLKRNLLPECKVHCDYDEFSCDILHNQILRSTIRLLLTLREVNPDYRKELIKIDRHLIGIRCIQLTKPIFHRVQLNSNNSFYHFLLNICELIFDNIMINEKEGTAQFKDFIRDEQKMATLFEDFVRNFYKLEQKEYSVSREIIPWDATFTDDSARRYLPNMHTDISLVSHTGKQKIVIDTKYYKEIFSNYYDVAKIRQGHLAQLFTYIQQNENRSEINRNCIGILLYPTVSEEVGFSFETKGHQMSVKTINLNQHWSKISKDLLKIIQIK
jgi:5-methylcytosine-specific restriction enzyme subunit McrC